MASLPTGADAQALTPGSVVGWSYNDHGQISIPAGLTDVKAVAAGYAHSLALKADGSVVGWGWNGNGETSIPADLTGVKAVAAGYAHSLALKADGSVVGWGWNGNGETSIPADLTGVKAVAAGDHHSLALKADGSVVGWGHNIYGQTSIPAGLTDVNAVAAGGFHSLAANVPYTFIGFLAPVDNPSAVNLGRAGRAYPVKWQLKDAAGNFVSALSAVKSITFKPAQCGAFNNVVTDALETETSGKSGLSYDALSNQFSYNWATPPSAGCYALFLTLDTGQVQQAFFNMRK